MITYFTLGGYNGSSLSSVGFKSISSNKTCNIQSLNYGMEFHESVVTPIGVITCGGMTPYIIRKKCFRLTNRNTWEQFPSLNRSHPRFDMIVLGDIIVAFDYDNHIMNILTNTIKLGPNLNVARYRHGCTRIRDDSLIVAGGFSHDDYLISSETLKIEDLRWTNGLDLKEPVFDNKLVTSIQKDYIAYNFGGKDENGSKFNSYGLNQDGNEWQFLDYMHERRHFTSIVNIPTSMLPWCYN